MPVPKTDQRLILELDFGSCCYQGTKHHDLRSSLKQELFHQPMMAEPSLNVDMACHRTLVETLRNQISGQKKQLEALQANCSPLPFENEALLLHEIGVLARKPPFAKTTRRKVLYANIEFPRGIGYNPAVERPITLLTDEFKAKTASYNFASLHMDPSELMLHWFVMFTELNLFHQLNIDPETLREFFRLVCNAYRDQVYHNFQHAMDVAQFAYAIYMNSEACRQKLDAVDMFSCLVLGLAHDMGTCSCPLRICLEGPRVNGYHALSCFITAVIADHPGVNNAFLIKTRDPIAMLYNDTSVLESAHAASLFCLMSSKPTANILGNMSEEVYRRCRKTILRGILATDMSRHFDLVKVRHPGHEDTSVTLGW